MRTPSRFSPRRNVLTGVWGALGVVGVVLVGVWRSLPAATVLLGVLVVLVVVVAVLAVRLLRAGRAADGIEASIRAQSERDLGALTPARQAEVERLREQFEKAVDSLKRSKLAGDGVFRSGKRALYALPWYLMIGPPGAGKTTALLNSGLQFPGGAERVRGLGGTRNCDWFFSDRAILLDTAGRYTAEDEDREEWDAFLGMLAEHRPERPVNGVLVAVPVPDLVGGSAAEVDAHAERVRRRIDEVAEKLGVRAPVYVLFTKADLVQGFTEFFGDLGRDERGQVWGATLDLEGTGGTYEGAREAFEREFDRLAAALLPHRNARLSRPTGREERRRIYVFPIEVAAAKERLARFVAGVFGADAFEEGPMFRGFYLTSGTQEGAPIDRVIQSIASRFGLPAHAGPEAVPAPAGPASGPAGEAKSYFLKGVFTDVVIPDRGLARRSRSSARRSRRAAAGTAVAAAVLLLVLVGATVQGAVRSRADLGRLLETAAVASEIEWERGAADPNDLARLEALREEVARLEGGRPVTQLGLDRRGTVLDEAQGLYYGLVRDLVAVYGLDRLERALDVAVANPDGTATEAVATGVDGPAAAPGAAAPGAAALDSVAAAGVRVRAYDDLKAFLLLTSESGRLGEAEDDRAYLKGRLASLVQAGAVGTDTTGRGREADLVARQTDAFAEALARGVVDPFVPDAPLVERVRRAVYEPPSLDGLYNRIRQEGLYTLPPLTLADAVPEEQLWLFRPGPAVNGFFTREGWERFAQPSFRRASEDPGRDDWVMGRDAEEVPEALRDPAAVFDRLVGRYNAEYVAAWNRFLRQIEYRPIDGLGGASEVLVALGNPTHSPLLYLLSVVTEETTFEVPLGDRAAAAAGGIVDRARRAVGQGRAPDARGAARGAARDAAAGGPAHPITAAFAGVHALKAPLAPTGEAAPELYKALEGIGALGRSLEAVAIDPALAAEFRARAEQPGGPVYQTRRDIEQATRGLDPDVRRALFMRPLDVGMAGARGAADAGANEAFAGAVGGAFESTLAGRYPFDPRSSVDAPVGDVAAFFDPQGGVVAQFVQGTLGGRTSGPNISPAATRFFERARLIGQALVSGGQPALSFELQPDTPARTDGAPAADQVYARIHGAESSYRMGSYRPWTRVSWPGEPGAVVGISTREGSLPSKEYGGDWAVFRMLQDARVRQTGSNTYDVEIPFREEGYTLTARYALRTPTSTGLLTDPAEFFQISVPPSLTP